MNLHLEGQLHALADDLSAPPSDEARTSVSRRTRRLRRRRQTRRAVAGGLLVVTVVAGLLALQSTREGSSREVDPVRQPDVSTDREAGLPAWTFEHEGWTVVAAENPVYRDRWLYEPDGEPTGTFQVFHSEDPLGPAALVQSIPAHGDPLEPGAAAGEQEVAIGDTTGYLYTSQEDHFLLAWNLPGTDSIGEIQSVGLSRSELLDFAAGLRYPPQDDDRSGFTATELPTGLVEVPQPTTAGLWDARRLTVENEGSQAGTVEINVVEATSDLVALAIAQQVVLSTGSDQIQVGDRDAYAFEGTEATWTLVWEESEGAIVRVDITGDSLTLDEVVDGLRPLSEEEWGALEASLD